MDRIPTPVPLEGRPGREEAAAGRLRPPRPLRISLFLAVPATLTCAGSVLAALDSSPAAPRDSASKPPLVVLEATSDVAVEGGKAGSFRIRRDVPAGDRHVRIDVGGDARPDLDYAVRGQVVPDGTGLEVSLPDGIESVELTVEATDDVAAEADETLVFTLQEGEGYRIDEEERRVTVSIPRNDFTVTTTRDEGEGSLRQALLNALALDGPDTVRFDSKAGPFATPQTILLTEDLPDLSGELTIDGTIEDVLWQATGVTVSGGGRRRVFNVLPGGKVVIRSLTVTGGRAKNGGGIANAGDLVVKDVTLLNNEALRDGGGLANLGGAAVVINSTFVGNRARKAGGGLSSRGGTVTVTHCTFSENLARTGGGLHSDGRLLVRNSILANSGAAPDCVARGAVDPASTHNLIESSDGCGEPITTRDPDLSRLGHFNGAVPTMPLGGASPAINLGDYAASLDEDDNPLRWDQRGNGDPRSVAGFPDLGAFETQAWPVLKVDTFEDSEFRACTGTAAGTCSLRGAILLANATAKADTIRFDPRVFSEPRVITLQRPLPDLATDMIIDGSDAAGVTLRPGGPFPMVRILPEATVRFERVVLEELPGAADRPR